MPATRDRMQDVFPIEFSFARGEQPHSEKLTKWAQLEELAFQRIVGAIGDPSDYSVHVNASSSRYDLSWEKLQQTSLARFSGPSSIVSPMGNNLAEPMGSITMKLDSGRNSWRLGFPLIKAASASHVFTPQSYSTAITSIDLDADISLEYFGGATPVTEMTTRKADIRDVEEDGDYHINYATGTVTTYTSLSADVNLIIAADTLHFFSAGAPWTTHNVIPDWKDPSTAGVTVAYVSDAGGVYNYTITLPNVDKTPRTGTGSTYGAPYGFGTELESYSAFTSPAEDSQYRFPMALLVGAEAGDIVPEGFLYLYDNDTESIIPLTTFTLVASGSVVDPHSLAVAGPDLGIGSTVPSINSSRYRIITVGASLADQVSYLMSVVRDNCHVGLSSGTTSATSLSYTSPLSHDSLVDRYSVANAPSVSGADNLYHFKESNYPTNSHPQYLHRSGYMENDHEGNDANAMRGHLVFCQYDDDNDDYISKIAGGSQTHNTFGVVFGGSNHTEGSTENSRISWEGAYGLNDWSSGPADRFGFSLSGLGSSSPSSGNYGAVTHTPLGNSPLYLRGAYSGTSDYTGAVLGFDLGRQSEMNYIKLFPAVRVNFDVENAPAKTTENSAAYGTSLPVTPSLSNRLNYRQIREFRFRAAPYIEDPWNADDGLGAIFTGHTTTNTYDIVSISAASKSITIAESEASGDFKVGDTVVISGSLAGNNGNKAVTAVASNPSGTTVYVNETTYNEIPISATIQTDDVSEFDRYFTSPGMVGADFFNVYSNAIFFSDQGDGQYTSFTERGDDWLNDTTADAPSGLYYYPQNPLSPTYGSTEKGRYVFVQYGSVDGTAAPTTATPLEFGVYYGAKLSTIGHIQINNTTSTIFVGGNGVVDIASQNALSLLSVANNINLTSSNGQIVVTTPTLVASSIETIVIGDTGTTVDFRMESALDVEIDTVRNIELTAGIDAYLRSTAGNVYLITDTNNIFLRSSNDIKLDTSFYGGGDITLESNDDINLWAETPGGNINMSAGNDIVLDFDDDLIIESTSGITGSSITDKNYLIWDPATGKVYYLN